MVTSILLVVAAAYGGALAPDTTPGVHARHLAERPVPAHRMPRDLDAPSQVGAYSAWVYGYYAYWAGTIDDLPWDRLTHVAIFDVGLTAQGGLSGTHRWTDVIAPALALAEPYGVKIHLAVTSFDAATMSAVLGNASTRAAAAQALADLVNDHGGHGVSVDFEGMSANNRDHLVDFTQMLSGMVEEVTVATPAVDWNGAYDYDALAAASDGLFIMGYDYHWKGGSPGPVAPLYGGPPWGMYALDWSVADYFEWDTPPDKIILGLPLYGYSWPTTNTNVPGTSTGNATSVLFADAVVAAEEHGRQWDDTTKTPYYFPNTTRQTFYDDTESLDHKIGWAIGQGLRGVGFWAVNYEGGDPAFWDMVAMHTQVVDDPTTGGDDTGDPPSDDGADPPADTGDTDGSIPPPPSDDDGAAESSGSPNAQGDGTGAPLVGEAEPGACACRSTRSPMPWWMLVLAPLFGRARRARGRA